MKFLIFFAFALMCIESKPCLESAIDEGNTTTNVLKQRPILYFHGYGVSCSPDENKVWNRKCIEVGSGIFGSLASLYDQTRIACEILTAEIFDEKNEVNSDFKYGFHLQGISQGGLIARLVFHLCPKVRPHVKTLLTVGTPNLGINTKPDKIYMKGPLTFLESVMSEETLLRNVSFYQYRNKFVYSSEDLTQAPTGLMLGPVVEDLLTKVKGDNGEYITNLKEKKIYNKLDLMLNVYFAQDKVVIPPSSATFEIEEVSSTPNESTWSKFNRKKWKESVGLSKLYKRGHLISCKFDSDHLEMTPADYSKIMIVQYDRLNFPDALNSSCEDLYRRAAEHRQKQEFDPSVKCSKYSGKPKKSII